MGSHRMSDQVKTMMANVTNLQICVVHLYLNGYYRGKIYVGLVLYCTYISMKFVRQICRPNTDLWAYQR